MQEEVIQSYYNATHGHGYTWGRIPLNSCDFTEQSYSFDDVIDDFNLKYFDTNATKDRQNIIPFIWAARNITSDPPPIQLQQTDRQTDRQTPIRIQQISEMDIRHTVQTLSLCLTLRLLLILCKRHDTTRPVYLCVCVLIGIIL